MAELDAATAARQVKKLGAELDKRCTRYRLLDRYYEGECPVPQAVTDAKMTRAYSRLMPLADAPWGALVVDSKLDRLEVLGLTDEDNQDAADEAWGIWQDNQMDSSSKLAHSSALISGRAYALVWPYDDSDTTDDTDTPASVPQISLDTSEQMIVQYREGSQRERVQALRRWEDEGGDIYATLYRREGLYKFRKTATAEDSSRNVREADGWVPRAVMRADGSDEPWPLPNPFDVVPVIELPVNRRLKPGSYGHARGEYEHCRGLLDRISLLTFLGLVISFWMGFPMRGTIGDRIIRDDDDKPVAPFDFDPGEVFQIENPEGKIAEFKAADRSNLSIFDELAHLAAITKTPRHYFPLPGALSNIAADTIRADEGAMHAAVTDHKGSLGEGWEEVLRVAGLMGDIAISPRASLVWADHESRSLAERADAASKLKDILPWQPIAQMVLNASDSQLKAWAALRSSDGFGQLLAAAANPVVSPGGVVLPNGNMPPTGVPVPGNGGPPAAA